MRERGEPQQKLRRPYARPILVKREKLAKITAVDSKTSGISAPR
jgi:hypothetical protein